MINAGRLMHVMLNVTDIDASLAFYKALGLHVQVDRSDGANGRRNLFLGFGPEASDALIELSSPSPDPAPAFGHVALGVPDVERVCAQLATAGVAITRAPRRLASGSVIAWTADPDGHAIELVQAAPAAAVRQRIAHDGLRFSVLEQGVGPALLLLHGGASRADHFTDLMALLGPRFRTVAYDQRGFAGTGAAADTVIDHERWAADVVAVMDALGIARAALIGWSMGASIAINAARRWPDRISAIVLLGAPDPARAVDVARLRERQRSSAALDPAGLVARDTAELAANLGITVRHDRALINRLLAERAATPPALTARAIDGYATRPDLAEALTQVACPIHLVTGAEDRICPLAGAQALQALVPQATLDLVPGCGHYYAVEAPQTVAEIIVHRLAVSGTE